MKRFVVPLLVSVLIANARGASEIDATSLESIHKSLEGARPDDVAIVKKIICDTGDLIDRSKPDPLELTMVELRRRFAGKTVSAVADEVRKAKADAADALAREGDQLVSERNSRWL